VLVVNAKQILDSPLLKKHFLEHIRAALKSNDEAASVLQALGFDPLKDLSSITCALSVIGNDAKFLIVAHGNFDRAKFEGKAEEVAKNMGDVLKVHKEGDRKIYEVKVENGAEKPYFVGIVDQTSLVAGSDKQSILDVFAKSTGAAKGMPKPEIRDLIEKADAKQSLWFAATANAFLKGELSSDDKARKNLEKMNSITAALMVDKGVKVALVIAAKSPESAKELAEEIKEGLNQVKGLLALMADQNKEIAPLVDTVGNLLLNTEGNTVTLKSEVSEELIEKGLKKK
jgi:hypothetical protein